MAKYSRAGRRTLVGTLSLLASVHVPQYVLADDAGTKPAVSGLNAKVEGAFGDIDGEGFGYGGGSVAAPLGHQFGVQLDLLGGSYDGEFIGSAGGHAFWRDPDVGLLGLYASYTEFDGNGGVHQSKYGVEGELYLDRLTLSGVGGYAGGDVSTHGFSIANASYYLSDEFRLTLGHRYANRTHVGAAGAEGQVFSENGVGVSLFAEGRLAEGNEAAVWAGLRLYFGADKTLIRRHREDDPQLFLTEDLFELTSNTSPPPSAGNNEF